MGYHRTPARFTPRPVISDADALDRMKALSATLRSLACPADAIPHHLLAEGELLKRWTRKRVAQETAKLDQAAAAVLHSLDDGPPTSR